MHQCEKKQINTKILLNKQQNKTFITLADIHVENVLVEARLVRLLIWFGPPMEKLKNVLKILLVIPKIKNIFLCFYHKY